MQFSPATSALSPSEASPTPCPLLTAAESLFHACLENLASHRCHIQCKPRLANVLHHESLVGFLKLCQRHIDFLICRMEDWLPMLAIEFDEDDGSADRLNRKARDRLLVNNILQTIGIPLLRVHARELDQIETLVHKLSAAWQQRMAALAAEPPHPAPETTSPPPIETLEACQPTVRLANKSLRSLFA